MLHTIQADFYRLFRSKAFWIIQGSLFLYLLFGVLYGAVFYSSYTEETAVQTTSLQGLTGIEAVQAFSTDSILLVSFVILILVIQLLGSDFSKRLYKNVLTYGLSRTEYFLSKMMVLTSIIFFETVSVYICLLLISSAFNGLGNLTASFPLDFFFLIFKTFISILCWACFCMGVHLITYSFILDYLALFALLLLAGFSENLPIFMLRSIFYLISACILLAGYLAFQKKDL